MSFARFSTDFRAKFARSRTPDAHFFESKRITDSLKSCSDAMQFAQRTLAESSHFLCARHAEILKILHFFHANFAAKCASSRLLTCAFVRCQCTADSVNSCSDAMGRWPADFMRAVRRSSKNFANYSSARFWRRFCVISTPSA